MATVRDLRNRIRSLKSTQQITKAMKQIASTKIRRAEELRRQSRPFAAALSGMLRDLLTMAGHVDHPFMNPGKEGAPSGIILITADKGLAGAFNSNLIRTADVHRREHPNVRWYSVGIKGRNALRRLEQETAQFWPQSRVDKRETARAIAARVSEDFSAGAIGEILMISSKFASMTSQKPELRKLVPVEPERDASAPEGGPQGSVEFEPSPEFVLEHLLPTYLEFTIYAALLETDACFFAAQLMAMSNATDNADQLIDDLTIVMNNARQAAITKELLEIVGGAEALVS